LTIPYLNSKFERLFSIHLKNINKLTMAVTRLERKVKRNRINAVKRQNRIKQLLKKPVIKNVDIEAVKASFANKISDNTTSIES
jgi:hypothetical protein